ncbi:MAG: radical SAM protein [Kiritimatiellae bacterium]|nr:radical SAM protein [Kiritimatiellia bacterium]
MRWALDRSEERRHYAAAALPAEADRLDDAHLAQAILQVRPAVLACTLYLWNIERTLLLLKQLRRVLPSLSVVVGGPEVSRHHPFLFKSAAVDVAVAGDGEPVFPAILRALRRGKTTDFRNVAWRGARGWTWGRAEPPHPPLNRILPPPAWRHLRPDARGMAYLEATRGCPMDCAYCSYSRRRTHVSHLTAEAVLRRVAALREAGAREVRFIDPTFNAHPRFDDIVAGIARVNHGRRLRFFAELRADRVTKERARALAAAGFAEIEVGVQCRNPAVLRAIRRPTELHAVEAGIRHLAAAGIKVTLDLMYGLPGQGAGDVRRAVRWASRRRNVRIQCLQTLLLPGTELRAKRRALGLRAPDRPPYAVCATPAMSADALRRTEDFIERTLGYAYDCPTRTFVGKVLPDLFAERVQVNLDGVPPPDPLPGRGNRRAVIFRGQDLFAHRESIRRAVGRAIRHEPFALWQFVLAVRREEPLDLLDILFGELARHPPLVMDHFLGIRFSRLRASRRVFVKLAGGRRFDPAWVRAAEGLLSRHFF